MQCIFQGVRDAQELMWGAVEPDLCMCGGERGGGWGVGGKGLFGVRVSVCGGGGWIRVERVGVVHVCMCQEGTHVHPSGQTP